MSKNNNTPASAGVTSKEVLKTKAVETPVVETPLVETAKEENEKTNEVEVIPSNVFVAEDGTKVEFAVQHFIFGKRKYTVEEAVAEIPEALQELYERNSFIFKKA